MRLTGAFFANKAGVVDDMLNVEGGFWSSSTVAKGSIGIHCNCVVLCDTEPDDVGQQFGLRIDAAGPSGRVWTPAHATNFDLTTPMKFMVATHVELPIEPTAALTCTAFGSRADMNASMSRPTFS